MDRDMVNCLHYIYQWGEITVAQLGENNPRRKLFWCLGDTRQPLGSRNILCEDLNSHSLTVAPGVYDLLDMVENQLRTIPRPDYAFGYPLSAPIRSDGGRRPAFLAISYDPAFDPVRVSILEAASAAGFRCEVTEDLATPGDIVDQVWQGIRASDTVVADITRSNPNVFYEIGLAHALGKEVILLSQDLEAPFDIRSSRRIRYDLNDLGTLKTNLEAAFRALSARYPHEGLEPRF
jgi:hypothetical protein